MFRVSHATARLPVRARINNFGRVKRMVKNRGGLKRCRRVSRETGRVLSSIILNKTRASDISKYFDNTSRSTFTRHSVQLSSRLRSAVN